MARRALEARVLGDPRPSFEIGGALERPHGAFVTIYCGGELRGCLGRLESDWAVFRVVAHLAEAVGDSDPRFEPVTREDLPEIDIEISILTPEREVHSIDEIEIGRHGLVIEQGARRGLLLPQVPLEYHWDLRTFVEQTCLKAGLPPDAWRRDALRQPLGALSSSMDRPSSPSIVSVPGGSKGARLFVFEAQVFGETRG